MATLYGSLTKKYGFNFIEKWYQHRSDKILKNEEAKLICNNNIFTDHIIETRKPDIDPSECFLIDTTVI